MRSMLECQVCGKPCDESLPCMRCGALFYCSDKHKRMHAVRLGHAGEECQRMSHQMNAWQDLTTFPFPWSKAQAPTRVTAVSQTEPAPGSSSTFLQLPAKRKLHAAELLIQHVPEQAPTEDLPAVHPSVEPSLRMHGVCSAFGTGPLPVGHRHTDAMPASAAARDAACSMLMQLGIHKKGAWRHACTCRTSIQMGHETHGSDQASSSDGSTSNYSDGESNAQAVANCKHTGSKQKPIGTQWPGLWTHIPQQQAAPRQAACMQLSALSEITEDEVQGFWLQHVWQLPASLAPPFPLLPNPRLPVRSHAPVEHRELNFTNADCEGGPKVTAADFAVTKAGVLCGKESLSGTGPSNLSSMPSIADWQAAYGSAALGLQLASPAALLLHFPLTLLHALQLAHERSVQLSKRSSVGRSSSGGSGVSDIEVIGKGSSHSSNNSMACPASEGRRDSSMHSYQARTGSTGNSHSHSSSSSSGQGYVGASDTHATQRRRYLLEPGLDTHVLVLGPRYEIELLDHCLLLLRMLPHGTRLHIFMLGPHVPAHMHGRAFHACTCGCTRQIRTASDPPTSPCAQGLKPAPAANQSPNVAPPLESASQALPSVSSASLPATQPLTWGLPAPAAVQAASQHCTGTYLTMHLVQDELHHAWPQLQSQWQINAYNTLVFGPNAGLAAYASWLPTLQLLLGKATSPQDKERADKGANQIAAALSLETAKKQGPSAQQHTSFNSRNPCLFGAGDVGQRVCPGQQGVCPGQALQQEGCEGGDYVGSISPMACIFTDYCEEAALLALQAAASVSGGVLQLQETQAAAAAIAPAQAPSVAAAAAGSTDTETPAHVASHTQEDQGPRSKDKLQRQHAVFSSDPRVSPHGCNPAPSEPRQGKVSVAQPRLQVLQPQPNPFRQPLPLCLQGNALPCFSNGFLFGWLP